MNDELDVNQQPSESQQTQYGGQQTADQRAPYAYAQQGQYGQAQQQAQYGYAQQQGQYTYTQQQAYAAPSRPAGGHHGKGGGWITFLRVFLWIWFVIVCLAGVVFFGATVVSGHVGMMLTGFAVLLGCVLLAFLSVAGGMIALDAAANIKRTATNSARILELLQKRDK